VGEFRGSVADDEIVATDASDSALIAVAARHAIGVGLGARGACRRLRRSGERRRGARARGAREEKENETRERKNESHGSDHSP